MEKLLRLKIYVDGGINDTPFPNADNQIEIGQFRYDAKRMGGAPTITASVNYPSCLDDEWTDKVYAEFNGEKYYLKQTPTSSYNNESTMYKHDLELVSERVNLDKVYFFDTVIGDPQDADKPVSDSTKVVFFGNIREFVARLNSSLQYSGLDYTVVVDDEIQTEEKLMSFEDQFFSNVLQEIYNTYEVPYYFEGKTIHIGWAKDDVVIPPLSYGVDDALLSITKNNANYKIVNRVTGTGSSDNIPFYYPNNSPKGVIAVETNREDLEIAIRDQETFSDKIAIDGVATYRNAACEITSVEAPHSDFEALDTWFNDGFYDSAKDISLKVKLNVSSIGYKKIRIKAEAKNVTNHKGELIEGAIVSIRQTYCNSVFGEPIAQYRSTDTAELMSFDKEGQVYVYPRISVRFTDKNGGRIDLLHRADFKISITLEDREGWEYQGKMYDLKDLGLGLVEGTPRHGDTITQTLVKYVKTSQTLMPSIYRETDGAERFYNAINEIYPFKFVDGYELKDEEYVGEDGMVHHPDYHEYNNPYVEGHPKEHIITVDDIKPTIKEAVNSMGLRMDMFSEFAYDLDDNDETEEDESGERNFVHSYFFAKLRKLDFNLFDHAIENQPMTISFTSGDCGACNFEIGVTEEFPQKNPVQVNADGTLKRDEKGRVICGQFEDITEDECQPQQQDTINNEVWIALKKEEDTYGILMPKATIYEEDGVTIKEAGHRPKACNEGQNDGDTFVILGINLPKSYIINAEKQLEAEIIKYMKENNDEKFTFSIGFSRIYFEENDILDQLSENSKIQIVYNNKPYDLYVSSFSYNMSEGDILPEIRVELDDTLKVSQNAIQNAINQVKSELGRAIGNIDVVGAGTPYFIRKDVDDEARGRINFTKGIKFGEGGKVEVLDNNSAKLTIEYLEVTKKASFTSLEIQEKTHVGGQILVTPAAINCGEVEEFDDFYRCYFQTKGANGDEIFNQFAVGDQAICQTYNAWGSKYYWRLVTGIGEDYIDLSKSDCDEDSGIPTEADKIIQLGNRNDASRQNAIVIAAYGDGSPYIIQYKGINSFEIAKDKIVTKLASDENIFTGAVHMTAGSEGLENLKGLPEAIEKQLEKIEVGGQNMLRNSGFTGDYLSAQIADQTVLDQVDQTFNPPLIHWDDASSPAVGATVRDSDESQSGKEVVLVNGSISQSLYQKVIANESYMLSFKAKGTSLTYSVGGVTQTVELTEDWMGYVEKIETIENGSRFSITNGNCVLCDLQLERGTIATAWGNSYLDNASDRLYYQSQQYVSDALKNATEGSTDIYGGLVLTRHIKVGDGSNTTDFRETGGTSGYYFDGNSPAFWAGGDFDKAVSTAAKYETDTTTPEGEIPYVVTHGGRIIANDAIIRGTIYATNGEFNGVISVDAPNVSGRVTIDDNGLIYYGQKSDGSEYQRVLLGGTCQGASLVAVAPNADARYCVNAAILAVGDEETNAIHANGDVVIFGGTLYLNTIDFGTSGGANIYGEVTFDGRVNGLRSTYVISDSNMHFIDCYNDASVLIDMTSGIAKVGVVNAFDGNEVIIENRSATLQLAASKSIYDHYNGNFLSGEITTKGVIRLVYYEEVGYWTMTWIDRY